MKKIFSLFILLIIAVSLCACNSSEGTDVHNHDNPHTHEAEVTEATQTATESKTEATQPETEETLPEVTTADATGPLSSKHSQKIDVPFEKEYSQAISDEDKTKVCDKYRGEWEKIGKRYYNELIHYSGDVPVHPDFSTDKELHEFVVFRKGDFESYFESDSKSYLEDMEKDYGKGDKANALLAEHKFYMQRSYALEMIKIYELLGEFNGQVF